MSSLKIAKISLIAVALVLAASVARTSTLEASGYIVASSRSGEASCQPGGDAECSGATQLQ